MALGCKISTKPDMPMTKPRIRRGVKVSFKKSHAAGNTQSGVVYANTIDLPAGKYCNPTLTNIEKPTICNQPILKIIGISARTGMRSCLVAIHKTKNIRQAGTSLKAVTHIGETNSSDFFAMTQFTPQMMTSRANKNIARLRREASTRIGVVAKATRCIGLDTTDRRRWKMGWKNQMARFCMLFNQGCARYACKVLIVVSRG